MNIAITILALIGAAFLWVLLTIFIEKSLIKLGIVKQKQYNITLTHFKVPDGYIPVHKGMLVGWYNQIQLLNEEKKDAWLTEIHEDMGKFIKDNDVVEYLKNKEPK